jgi:small subunit ribosomal protein S1
LVHISEISWSLIGDPKSLYKIGDEVTVKVIEINKDKVSLSIKSLSDNPWKTVQGKYKKEDSVKAVVIKISDHGALVSVEEGIYGLVHVSEFSDIDELRKNLQLGDTHNFKINIFDVDAEKMTLTLDK